MPEGPEILYLQTILNKECAHTLLQEVKIISGRYKRHAPPKGYDLFRQDLPMVCTHIQKKGKVLFFYYEKGWVMISKLGMTGWWNVYDAFHRHGAYRNLVFEFQNSLQKPYCLVYSDPRNFGTIEFTQELNQVHMEYNKLGLDITDRTTTWKTFSTRMQKVIDECRKSCSVEEVLTDQKRVLCGIGNYLKSEILYDAKIAPMRTISNISVSEWKLLFRIMKSKTRKMYTILLRGKEKEFEESMKVYSKKKDPFGNKVETYTDPRGRTTHWVPSVQK